MNDDKLQSDLSLKAEISLYYDLYIPDETAASAPLLIAVHGYGAHKRYMMREARLVAPPGCVIASIQAPHPHYRRTDEGYRIGYGWLSDERPAEHIAVHQKFILDVVGSLSDKNLIDTSRIAIYGFSQACALNFRCVFTYPDLFKMVIGVCGGIPGDLDTNKIYQPTKASTLYLYGNDDEFYTQEQFAGFDRKLAEILPNYKSRQYTAGHEISPAMREDIKAFLSVL